MPCEESRLFHQFIRAESFFPFPSILFDQQQFLLTSANKAGSRVTQCLYKHHVKFPPPVLYLTFRLGIVFIFI
jgi:hypothetical protein